MSPKSIRPLVLEACYIEMPVFSLPFPSFFFFFLLEMAFQIALPLCDCPYYDASVLIALFIAPLAQLFENRIVFLIPALHESQARWQCRFLSLHLCIQNLPLFMVFITGQGTGSHSLKL